jgi:hypothetical protein
MSETGTCGKCASEISTEATKCPNCGYEAKTEASTGRSIMMIIGLLLTGTIIGAVIGIPLLYLGYKSIQYHKELTPTNTSPDDTVSFKELLKY